MTVLTKVGYAKWLMCAADTPLAAGISESVEVDALDFLLVARLLDTTTFSGRPPSQLSHMFFTMAFGHHTLLDTAFFPPG